jgi:2,3-bisphosphoglycerate-independent phosphoglycerate mutase
MMDKKVMLIILDGWGLYPNQKGNAPFLAKTPTLDYVYSNYPKTSLTASGLEVGLSEGEPGNSEVGHLNIGSGRVVWENLPRIDQAILSGEFYQNSELKNILGTVKKKDSALHLIGLVSDGGVHSHIRHLYALLDAAKKEGLTKVYIHFISDGRDTAPKIAQSFASQVESYIKKIGIGQIATLIGRFYAMDRDKNWGRQKKSSDLFLNNVGERYPTVDEALEKNYADGKSDENIEASVIGEGGTIQENDGIILFNHRSDRMRQLLSLFFGAEKTNIPSGVEVVSMTEYQKDQKAPAIFKPLNLQNTISQLISEAGLTQLHIAETEKFAHVTFFFKAGVESVYKGETDQIVPSKKVISCDKLPEMSADEVTSVITKGLEKRANFIVANYANGDMVGHTGVLDAAIRACEKLDSCLGKILSTASAKGYKVFITADHGNCEYMIDESTGEINKEHTTNPVPFVFLDFNKKPYQFAETEYKKEEYAQFAVGTPIGVLADIAPSILANLEIRQPKEMGGMDLSIAMQ